MTELSAVAFALLLVGTLGWRAADDAERPKVVLVQSDWSCRRSHAEFDARAVQRPDGAEGHEISPVLVCDAWSRR